MPYSLTMAADFPRAKIDCKANLVKFFHQDISSAIQLLEDILGRAGDLVLEGEDRVVHILCIIGRVGQVVEGCIAIQHRAPWDRKCVGRSQLQGNPFFKKALSGTSKSQFIA